MKPQFRPVLILELALALCSIAGRLADRKLVKVPGSGVLHSRDD